MKNISLENISVDNYGHKVLFTDVLFYEFVLLFSANCTHGCVFHCRGCLFTLHPMKIPKLYTGKSVLKFEECVSAETIMGQTKLYSTEIEVLFTNKLLANFNDTEMTRTSGQNSSSKMTFQQIDEFMASFWESPTVEFVMKNIRCFNNKPISSMVALNFSNSLRNGSMVRIDNATVLDSSSFLEYTVDAGAENSMTAADHHVELSNLNITNNQGNKEIVSVTQNLNGTIILENSLWNGNNIESTSMVFLSTTSGNISIINCNFSGNQGYNRGLVHITSGLDYPASVKIRGSSSVNNSAGKMNSIAGFGGAIYLELQSIVLTITDGTFTNNKAPNGGALVISVPQVSGNSDNSVSPTPAGTLPNPIAQPSVQQTDSQDNVTELAWGTTATSTEATLADLLPAVTTYSNNIRVNISFITFSENQALVQGGAVIFKGDGRFFVDMHSVKLESNSAHWGSGMIVNGNDATIRLSLTLCGFVNNTLKVNVDQNENQCLGGAISIYTNMVERLLMSENTLLKNTGLVGGALAVCSN